jgi:rhodanese-related sulfurtransferase
MRAAHRLALALALAACAAPPPPSTLLFPDEAHAQAATGRTTLIDVRLPRERRDPRFAEHTSLWLPFDRADPGLFAATVRGALPDPAAPVALICEVGERSAHARDALLQAGFSAVASVDQGYVGWRAEGLPLVDRPAR